MCLPNYLFFLCLKLSILSDVAFSWLVSCARATSHWLFPGFSSLFSFFIRWRSVQMEPSWFVVGVVFAFVCAHASGRATLRTGTDVNLCSYSQLLHFSVRFCSGPLCSHLAWFLLGVVGWILNDVAVGLFVSIRCTHVASMYKVEFLTFMKDSLSLHVSDIHKYFQDKGTLVTIVSMLVILLISNLNFILLLISLEVVF